jgi:Ni/Fe-hydrogenase subunit HybB-like protein
VLRTLKVIAWILWIGLLGWGLTGVVDRFSGGRELANYGSYVPWGLWVSSYIYFIGLSAGAFLLSSLIYVFQVRALRKIGRLALFTAALTLMMALLSIWFDLGHMWRAYEVMTRPNFTSMMAWMVWLYSAYFLLILVELWFELRCDLATLATHKGLLRPVYLLLSLGWHCPETPDKAMECHRQSDRVMRVLGSLGVPLAIAFHGGVGALFATLSARPYWHSSLFPIMFLTGALVSGGALILAMTSMTGVVSRIEKAAILPLLSKIVLGLILFDLILEWAEFSIPMWYGVGPEHTLLNEVLFGQYWYVFWIFHILLGSAIPIVLLIRKPADPKWTALAGGLIAVTFLSVRLNLVIPGLVTPQLEGLQSAYVDPRLLFEYVPSMFEWSVVAFIVALAIGLFLLGNRILPLRTHDAASD